MHGRVGLAAHAKRERNKMNQKGRLREYNYTDSQTIYRIEKPTNLKAKTGCTLSRVDKATYELV